MSANLAAVIMRLVFPHFVEDCNPTFCGLTALAPRCMAKAMNEQAPYLVIGQRMKAIREAFSDLKQGAWAEKHGFALTQYNNWEKGVRRVPVESAERLCDLYGLTLDFVYRGRRDGLSERASKVL